MRRFPPSSLPWCEHIITVVGHSRPADGGDSSVWAAERLSGALLGRLDVSASLTQHGRALGAFYNGLRLYVGRFDELGTVADNS